MSATTSPANIILSKPTKNERIPPSNLGYFRARNKNRVYEIVITEFENSGLTQAELAIRLGKGRDRVCRLLGAPGNWTLDTVSDLLFAISGAELDYSISKPFETAQRNQRTPEWLTEHQPDVAESPGTSGGLRVNVYSSEAA